MRGARTYLPEFVLLGAVLSIGVLGFWDLYLAPEAAPQPHHHAHLVTSFGWLLLLLAQLVMIARGNFAMHRKWGLAVLIAAPLVFATIAYLSVLSAARGVASGEGDMLLVQNVMVTLQFGLLVFLAFLFRRRRALHGSLMASTSILFGGIALFFALISFMPIFRIEGPDTFYRFGLAAMTAQGITLAAGALMLASAPKTRWPYLLAAGFFVLNEGISQLLVASVLIGPATRIVGALDPVLTFALSFVAMFALLAFMLLPTLRGKQARAAKP